MRRRLLPLLALGLVPGFAPTAASAAVRAVPASYPTITAGIAAALPGDTVLVAPGLYTTAGSGETYPLDVTTADVTLLGAGMGVSVLDMAGQAGAVVPAASRDSRWPQLCARGSPRPWSRRRRPRRSCWITAARSAC